MTRPISKTGLAAALAASAALLSACSKEPEAAPPNVLLICIDVLRADHVGTYGHDRDTTPTVDRLAAEGVVFEAAVSPAAWTKPAVPSYFTGRYPHQHGVYHSSFEVGDKTFSDVLRPEEVTLAEVFQDAGFDTVGVVTNGVIKGRLGFNQGFDEYHDGVGNADRILDRFEAWRDSRSDVERPFFAYLHFLDVHLPYDPPPGYEDYFGESSTEIDFGTDEWKLLKQRIKLGEVVISDDDRDSVARLYDAQLRYTDDVIGRVLDGLASTGELDDTLIVFLSDHGEELFERGGIGHGSSMYAELLNVPLVMRFPGGEFAGTRIEAPVSTVDVLPTLMDYFRLGSIDGVAGHTLLPLLQGGEVDPGRVLYSEGIHGNRYQQSVRRGNWKLVVTVKTETRTRDLLEADLRVEADVTRQADGRFEVSGLEVQRNQEDPRNKITGPIEAIGEGHLELLGFRLALGPDLLCIDHEDRDVALESLAVGATVKAYCEGVAPDELVVTQLKVRDPAKKRRVRLEGPLQSAPVKNGKLLEFDLAGRRLWMERTTFVSQEGSDATVDDAYARGLDPWVAAKEQGLPEERMLFDLSVDPEELTDLSALRPELVAELATLLEELRVPWTVETQSVDLDRDELDHLEHLGYAGDH